MIRIAALLVLAGPTGSARTQTVFASRLSPVGWGRHGGNLYLQRDTMRSYALSKFASDGTPIADVPVGSILIYTTSARWAFPPTTTLNG